MQAPGQTVAPWNTGHWHIMKKKIRRWLHTIWAAEVLYTAQTGIFPICKSATLIIFISPMLKKCN